MARVESLCALILVLSLTNTNVIEGQITSCGPNAEQRNENPIGTCICDQHLWVAPGCREGYFCIDTTGLGCYKVNIHTWLK